MKKLCYISGVILVFLGACATDSIQDAGQEGGSGNMITFRGETFAGTRTVIGDKDGSTYPVLWSEGDRIGIISTDEAIFMNAPATLNSSDAGRNSGIFVLETMVDVTQKTEVVIYYPHSSYTSYADGVLASSIPMEQRQARPGDSSHTGKYTLAYDKTDVEPGANGETPSATFSLTHAAAYVKLVVSSTEFSSYKLTGASIWSDGAAITGDIAVNVTSGVTNNSTPRNYATLIVEEPAALSSAQELWLVTLPVDLTGKDAYVSVAMTDGAKNVTIPVKVNMKELKANAVNTITVSGVKSSDNTSAWYCPEETRCLAGGWAYGDSNTFVTTADGEEITIDVKARGFFNGCEEPKYAKIIFANNLSGTNYTTAINGKRTDPGADDYAEYVEIDSDYKLKIKTTKGSYVGWFGKVGIMNAAKEYIWAFTVWYMPGGYAEHRYKNGVVMDRYIGDSYANDYDNWHGVGAYYQWGRPFSFSWGSITYLKAATNVTDLKVSAKRPDYFFMTDGAMNHLGDWWLGDWTGRRSDRKDDFWGNANSAAQDGSPGKGTKSIFDPCPKGWMVASPSVLKEVLAGKETDFETNGSVQSLIYKYEGNNKAYWKFSGLKWGATAGNPDNQMNDILGCWSNSPMHGYNASDHHAYQLYYRTSQGTWNEGGTRAAGQSVRCMKDTDNR